MVIKELTNEQIDKAVEELSHKKIIVKNQSVKQYIGALKTFHLITGADFKSRIEKILNVDGILPDDLKTIKSQLTVINDRGGFEKYVKASETVKRINYKQALKDIDKAYTENAESVSRFNSRKTSSTSTAIVINKLRDKGVVVDGNYSFYIYDKDINRFVYLIGIAFTQGQQVNLSRYGITYDEWNIACSHESSFAQVNAVHDFNMYHNKLKICNQYKSHYDSIMEQLQAL